MRMATRSAVLCSALICAFSLASAFNTDPEHFEFDSFEKIEANNETAPADVETLTPGDGKVKIDAKCQQPMEVGNGTGQVELFFFDASNSTCHAFNYTGSGGNDNVFLSELDCLNDCYTAVGEGEALKEEDVVIIGRAAGFPVASDDCRQPKDSGNCSDAETVERFYFAPEWQSCLAFKYSGCGGNGNRFESRRECERSCLAADGSACRGPSEPATPLKNGPNCETTECPEGYACSKGFGFAECCHAANQHALRDAHAEQCPSGGTARGEFGDYFIATFAANCDDSHCGPNEKCEQINEHFAKCCATTPAEKEAKPSELGGGVRRLADSVLPPQFAAPEGQN